MARIRAAARRYAEAAFRIACEHEKLEEWERNLRSLESVMADPLAGKVLTSPAVPRQAKLAFLEAQAGGLDPLVRSFARILLERDRLRLIEQIAQAYRELVNRHRGVETAEVVTAVPLDDKEVALLAHRLSVYTGKRVELQPRLDPEILGGVVARIGDQMIDGSVRGRLQQLRRAIAGD